jgi:simple sugar transport system ATP-binding protein
MTVAENIALGPSRTPGLSRLKEVEAEVSKLSNRFGLAVDPSAVIGDLTVGTRQRVEILKLSTGAPRSSSSTSRRRR